MISLKNEEDLNQLLDFQQRNTSKTIKIFVKKSQLPSYPQVQQQQHDPKPYSEETCDDSCTRYCKQYGCENKLFKVLGKCQRKLEKIKAHPDFDEAEFQRQLAGFQEANLPTGPFAQILIAKNVVQMNKKQRKWARKGKYWKCKNQQAQVSGQSMYEKC